MEQNNKLLTTLCIAVKGDKVLLGMKKRGFGKGKWDGFGGKVKEGESIEAAAQREMQEEAGVDAVAIAHVGVLQLINEAPYPIEMHVFRVDAFTGEPSESEEMKPQWFSVEEIPYLQMWPNDPYWLPLLLQGKKFKGKFVFSSPCGSASGGEGERIASHQLDMVS